jgi:replicative superfamily II helicase
LFDPEDPSPQFSFAGRGEVYTKAEMDDDLGWVNLEPWLIDGLRRGIAVHHAGMQKRYRGVVERSVFLDVSCTVCCELTSFSLFRQGVIRVVIATGTLFLNLDILFSQTIFLGTLALGVNAPTKTSVLR